MPNDCEGMTPSPVKPFVLVEDEYCHKDLKKADSCCNFTCKRQDDLSPAPAFVLTYYQIKYSKGKTHRVCKLCYDAAVKHNEELYEKLRRKEPLFQSSFPLIPDIVVIEDSDDECDDEEQTLDESVLAYVEENIGSVFESVLAQYDVNFQIEEAERNLKERMVKLQESSEEISQILTGLQESVDANRRQFYELFIQPRQEQPSIAIHDYELGDTSESNRSNITSKIAGVAMKKVTQINRPPGLSSKIDDSNLGQEVVALEEIKVQHKPLPPIGPLLRPRPRAGETVYVMKSGYYGVWSRAKIIGLFSKEEEAGQIFHSYKIKFEYRKGSQVKTVPGKQLAYSTPSPVRLPVGTRVIALFHDEGSTKECFYAGVIAEPPKSMNDYRYLVFFDDGYAQYIVHEKILLVCESSRNVWEDIHPETRAFIHTYLERFPERPMVKLQSGQVVKTEWNGKWWVARVIKIDCSLVKMHFDADNRTEWIYRGSTRLSPLYIELSNASRREQGSFGRHRGLGIASLKKRNMPYVEYTRTDMDDNKSDDSGDYHTSIKDQAPVRAVAKKSTTKRPENFPNSSAATVDKVPTFGRIESTQIKAPYVPRKFHPHQCSKACMLNITFNINDFKEHNPLVIPMLCGWQRYIQKSRARRCIIYRAPCGRRIRNMEELHCYLRIIGSLMGVDMFDFDFWVHCFDEFVMDRSFSNIKDVSYGMEKVPVSCVNNVDHTIPEFVQYSTRRIPMEGVPLNLNPEFLVCCDCTDDCKDRSKCACWQLTIQGTAMGGGAEIDTGVGYVYKRLPEPVPTGIYECNSKCKCSSTCLNRVVQHPLRLKLQVFKTVNRGWGIRCINDVPQGSFICIYAGRLLTEQGANEGGKNYGDEYLAELDYIEVVERLKDGYESDVPEDNIENMMNVGSNQTGKSLDVKDEDSQDTKSMSSSEEETENSQDAKDSDEDFKPVVKSFSHDGKQIGENSIRTRLRKRVSRQSSTESNQEKQKEKASVKENLRQKRNKSRTSPPVSSPNSCITVSDDEDSDIVSRPTSRFFAAPVVEMDTKPKYLSVRDFFGKEEFCYIMDAKNAGNIGRYLNHSCSPNVFVQNVFVDTHDLRFPWVAFFALTYIKAGTELTWDYNYDVGSVPGKVMYCHCGSQECRGRLL